MTDGRVVTRREMLALLGAGLVTAAGGSVRELVAATPRGAESDVELARWVVEQLAGIDVRTLAGAWRERHPAEATRMALAREILAGRRRGEALQRFLARKIAAEHRDGRAEVVDGWYLAPTEARLVALLQTVQEEAR